MTRASWVVSSSTRQDLPNQPPEVAEVVRRSLGDIEAFFREMIERGQREGQIPAPVAAPSTAQALLSMLVGLRLLARGAADTGSLQAIRDGAMRLVHAT
jgi:AcrR family transcriptional regulator